MASEAMLNPVLPAVHVPLPSWLAPMLAATSRRELRASTARPALPRAQLGCGFTSEQPGQQGARVRTVRQSRAALR